MRVRRDVVERVQSSQSFSTSQGERCPQLGSKYAQLQIVNALRLGERDRAQKMLQNLGHTKNYLSSDDFAYVLDYCAKAPDPLFGMETWRVMEEKAVAMDRGCYRSIIQACGKGGYLEEAFNWLAFVGDSDFAHAVLPLYNIFLSECGSRKSFTDADHCLELMERQLVGKSEITYHELLKFAVLQKNLSAVHDIWKECTRYYSPSIITLRKFIWSFTRLNAVEPAYSVLQQMIALATCGSASIRKSSSGRYHSLRVDIPIPSYSELTEKIFGLESMASSVTGLPETSIETREGLKETCMDQNNNQNPSHVPIAVGSSFANEVEKDGLNLQLPVTADISGSDDQYLQQEGFTELNLESINQQELVSGVLQKRGYAVRKLLRWSFNNVIHACVQSKNYKLAEHLFVQMLNLGLNPSGDTYDGFVKTVVFEKGAAYGMKVIESMEKRNIKPYNDTLATLSAGFSKDLELDIAENLLGRIHGGSPKSVYPFNAIFAACDIMDQPERAVRIFGRMKQLNIKSNIMTYELLFSLFGNVNVPYEKGNLLSHAEAAKRIKAIEKDMIWNGVQHNYTSIKNLIRAVGAEGMVDEMMRYLDRAESMLWNADPYKKSDLYNIVLHALIKAEENSRAVDLFKRMRFFGFPANVATYNMMIECCSMFPCFRSASVLLSMMLRDGFVPQTLTYNALLKVLLATDDFDTAVNILDQAISDGVELDIQLFNTILKQAYPKGRIDIIELIIELIHRQKIKPDPSTCWYTFSAYVECGFQSTAVEALQVLSLRMISEDDNTLQDRKAAFEDLLYSEEPDTESKIVEIFEKSQEFIATALLCLRWCAMNGVFISWSPNDSPWAKRLSSSYDTRREVM